MKNGLWIAISDHVNCSCAKKQQEDKWHGIETELNQNELNAYYSLTLAISIDMSRYVGNFKRKADVSYIHTEKDRITVHFFS